MILTPVLASLVLLVTRARDSPPLLPAGGAPSARGEAGLSEEVRAGIVARMLRRTEVHQASFEGEWLYLAVTDVDADWGAYAAGVCGYLARTGAPVPVVRMVDAAYLRAGRGFRELGMAYCA